MAEQNDPVMAEVMSLLEAEPGAAPGAAPGHDIPTYREKHAVLVCRGKCKEEIGMNLMHGQVKRLEDKDVIKYESFRLGGEIERCRRSEE